MINISTGIKFLTAGQDLKLIGMVGHGDGRIGNLNSGIRKLILILFFIVL